MDRSKIKNQLREKKLRIIFSKLQKYSFQNVLEIGAGDGFQSQILVKDYVSSLVYTDLNNDRLIKKENSKIKYEIGAIDAERIGDSFKERTSD